MPPFSFWRVPRHDRLRIDGEGLSGSKKGVMLTATPLDADITFRQALGLTPTGRCGRGDRAPTRPETTRRSPML
jgi:hypothetical protein